MNSRKWNDLDPRVRRLLAIGMSVEAVLKIIALVDLVRRPSGSVRGSRVAWAVAIVVVNTGGALPVYYLLRGRRRPQTLSAR